MNRILPNRRGASTLKIVLIIVGVAFAVVLLAVIGLVTAGALFASSSLEEAKGQQARTQLRSLSNNLEIAKLESGELPDTLDELKQLRPEQLKDPWGHSFLYNKTSKAEFTLRSVGPDGQDGTDDDISLKE